MEFRPLCIVADANVWIRTAILSDAVGSALTYYCGSMGVRLGLPDVVEREIHQNALRLSREASGRIRDSYRRLQLFGYFGRVETPTDEGVRLHVSLRLTQLEPYLERVELTLNHAKAALDRVLEQSAPNSASSQQFKDSAIWEAVLTLAERFAVRFVTADKAFYASQDYARGLADRLMSDIGSMRADIVVYSDLGDLLAALRGTATVPDHIEVAKRIVSVIEPEVRQLAEDRQLTIGALLDSRLTALPTSASNTLAVTFQARFLGGHSATELSTSTGSMEILAKGTCSLVLAEPDIDLRQIGLTEVTFDDRNNPETVIIGAGLGEEKT